MKKVIIALILLINKDSFAQQHVSLSSKESDIVYTFSILNNEPVYSISFKKNIIIDKSTISLQFSNGTFRNNLTIGNVQFSDTLVGYDLFAGKTSTVDIKYRQVIIPLKQQVFPYLTINLIVRLFKDGIAFRYEMPAKEPNSRFELLDESTTFNIPDDPLVHALCLPNYTSSHEGPYTHSRLSKIKEDTLIDMPALFELAHHNYLAITEAALLNYAGMYLSKKGDMLTSKLSPLPGQNTFKVKSALPGVSPWRVLLISDRIGSLIESNIITSLNEPSKIKDVSWLLPGKTTFPWWNGNVLPDSINAPGNNFVTAKYYIDFCARNGIEYHSVVEYGLHQWYTDDGVGFSPGPHADVTTPVPGLDMKEICDYAKSKGVKIRVWVHWAALYPKLDEAFTIFEKWGLSGMMVDFMDRDDQDMVNIQTEILEKAALHHLHIQFHGAYKNTGINRTYPNEFTREGTLNYEANKWNPNGIGPDHDIIMPFTRMLGGSTDYHLGGFRAVPTEKFRANYTRPLMLGTRCHMLAMYVVLENYLQMVCDYPEAYEGQKGFDFIKQVPTTWDETKVVDGVVNEYITIARRKKADWFVGTITNHSERTLKVSFSFLSKGIYDAYIYKDAVDTRSNPNHLITEHKSVTSKDFLTLKVAEGGGYVIRLVKK